MTAVSDETVRQLEKVYVELSRVVGRHPEGSFEEFVRSWWMEEQSDKFSFGCPDWRDRPAMILLVYAIRYLCGMRQNEAIRLAEMAIKELKRERKRKALVGAPPTRPDVAGRRVAPAPESERVH